MLIGTATASPYTVTWASPAAGYYALTAEAFDSAGATSTSAPDPVSVVSTTSTAPQLHVSGNQLVNAAGTPVVLHGADRSGGEFACVQGNGIWNGPMDQASITAMKSWGITAVRVPLNEACWNGESYVNPAYAGTAYQQAVEQYVSLLNDNGIVAILDLHWTDGAYTGQSAGCSSAQATCQKPMPDAAQAIPFWTSVATAFKGNDAVIFDLFNEPYPERADSYNETEGWQCWLNGGSSCVGISYTVAGMQSMVNAIRGAGANNVIMLGGLEYANDLTQWLSLRAGRPRSQPGRVLALVQLQHLLHPVVLDQPDRPGGGGRAGDRRRDRRERLRGHVPQLPDGLARHRAHQLPGVDLEQLGLLPGARADHRLRRGRDRLRGRVPGPPGDPRRRLSGVSPGGPPPG